MLLSLVLYLKLNSKISRGAGRIPDSDEIWHVSVDRDSTFASQISSDRS